MERVSNQTTATKNRLRFDRRRAARVITEVLSPINVVPVLLLLVAFHSAPDLTTALIWGLVGALFASALPATYIVLKLRRRSITDYHVKEREQRPKLALFIVPSVLVGAVVLALAGAPREMAALGGALLAGISIAALVTLFWKISVHVAVSAGTVVILALVYGVWMIVLSPIVGLSAWSRVTLKDHTIAQTVAGAALGCTVAGGVFMLLR